MLLTRLRVANDGQLLSPHDRPNGVLRALWMSGLQCVAKVSPKLRWIHVNCRRSRRIDPIRISGRDPKS